MNNFSQPQTSDTSTPEGDRKFRIVVATMLLIFLLSVGVLVWTVDELQDEKVSLEDLEAMATAYGYEISLPRTPVGTIVIDDGLSSELSEIGFSFSAGRSFAVEIDTNYFPSTETEAGIITPNVVETSMYLIDGANSYELRFRIEERNDKAWLTHVAIGPTGLTGLARVENWGRLAVAARYIVENSTSDLNQPMIDLFRGYTDLAANNIWIPVEAIPTGLPS